MEGYSEDGWAEVGEVLLSSTHAEVEHEVSGRLLRSYLLIPAILLPPLGAVFAGYGLHEMEPPMSIGVHLATFWIGVLVGTVLFWFAFPNEYVVGKIALSIFFAMLMALVSAFVGFGFVSGRYQIAL